MSDKRSDDMSKLMNMVADSNDAKEKATLLQQLLNMANSDSDLLILEIVAQLTAAEIVITLLKKLKDADIVVRFELATGVRNLVIRNSELAAEALAEVTKILEDEGEYRD